MHFSHTATLWDIWPSPIRMVHISSWLKSQGESGSGLRNLKFSLWQHVQLYLYISHITGRFDPHQTRWTIHHPKPIFEENLDLKSEFQNSTNSIHIWYITVLVNTQIVYYAILRNPTVRIICPTYRWYVSTYWSWIRRFSVKIFTTSCTTDITVIYALWSYNLVNSNIRDTNEYYHSYPHYSIIAMTSILSCSMLLMSIRVYMLVFFAK